MFTNITENCVVSPSGSSPSSAFVGDWHTYDNCWRVQAARSAARVKVGPGPLHRAFSHKPRSRRSPFLRSSPFCSVPCCAVCVPYWITRAAVRRTHSCLQTLMADHCPSWYGTLSTLVMIRSVTSVSRIYHSLQSRPFGFSPTNCVLWREDSCWKTFSVPAVEDSRKYWHWKF